MTKTKKKSETIKVKVTYLVGNIEGEERKLVFKSKKEYEAFLDGIDIASQGECSVEEI